MRITAQADYAIRITTLLAEHNDKLDAKYISNSTGVPIRFTLKILHSLKKGNIVKSIMGACGGFFLARPSSEISFLDVIEAIDGPIEINRCMDENFICTKHSENDTICKSHEFLFSLNEEIKNKLKNKKFN